VPNIPTEKDAGHRGKAVKRPNQADTVRAEVIINA
jgi:hypothetical protein